MDAVELTDLCNIRCDNRSFDKGIEEIIKPFRKMGSTIFGEVETCDGSKLDAKALQEDGEEIGH